jgi:hypothetical protein
MPSFTAPPLAAGEVPNLYIDGVLVPSNYDPVAQTLTPITPLARGTYEIAMSISDAAGNESLLGPSLSIELKPEENGLFEQLVSDPESQTTVDDYTFEVNASNTGPIGNNINDSISLGNVEMPIVISSPLGVSDASTMGAKETDSVNEDLKGLDIGMDPAIYVQNAVRALSVSPSHDTFVQAAVKQSQIESKVRNINVTNFSSANPVVNDLLDGFAFGSLGGMKGTSFTEKPSSNTAELAINAFYTEPNLKTEGLLIKGIEAELPALDTLSERVEKDKIPKLPLELERNPLQPASVMSNKVPQNVEMTSQTKEH